MKNQIETKLLVAQIEEILKEVTKSKTTILNRAELIQDKPMHVVWIDFIVRFTSHLNVIGIVLDEATVESLHAVEHSLGILLRACLFDCITVSETIVHMDEIDGYSSKEKQEEVYLAANTDQLKFLITRMESIKKKGIKLNSNVNLDKVVENVLVNYDNFFSDAKNRKFKFDKQKNMLNTIVTIMASERFQEDATEMLELWEHYSRYEHYGPLSAELLNMPIRENWNRMISVLMYTTHCISYIFACFQIKPTVSFLDLKIHELQQIKMTR